MKTYQKAVLAILVALVLVAFVVSAASADGYCRKCNKLTCKYKVNWSGATRTAYMGSKIDLHTATILGKGWVGGCSLNQ